MLTKITMYISPKKALLCMVLMLLTACSTSFIYNQLDWLIPMYVDDYVQLDADQQAYLNTKLKPFLDWHRVEELPSYIVFLDKVERDLSKPIRQKTVETWGVDVLEAVDRIELELLEVMLRIGEELSNEQIADLSKNIWKRQEELEQEYLNRDDGQYAKDSAKSLKKNIRRFLGSLNDEQEAIIDKRTESLQRFDRAWLEERKIWLVKLEKLLQRQPGWQDTFKQEYFARKATRTPAYNEIQAHNLTVNYQLVAEVLKIRNEQQTIYLQQELDDLRQTMRKLIAQ